MRKSPSSSHYRRRLICTKGVRHLVAATNEREIPSSGALVYDSEKRDLRRLTLAEVTVYGPRKMTLFDSGAIPNAFSTSLCKSLHLEPHNTKQGITIVNTKQALVPGEVSQAPVTVGPVTTELSCHIVNFSPYSMIVGRPSMKKDACTLGLQQEYSIISP